MDDLDEVLDERGKIGTKKKGLSSRDAYKDFHNYNTPECMQFLRRTTRSKICQNEEVEVPAREKLCCGEFACTRVSTGCILAPTSPHANF